MNTSAFSDFCKNIKTYIDDFDSKKYSLKLYFDIINAIEFSPQQIRDILKWKLSGNLDLHKLSKSKQELIKRAVNCYQTVNQFKKNKISETEFDDCLTYISPSGPVIPIFIKHICNPQKYALLDQHVYRSYCYLKNGKFYGGTITKSIVKNEYQNYCKFFYELKIQFKNEYSPKQIDGALMVYGKNLKRRYKFNKRV